MGMCGVQAPIADVPTPGVSAGCLGLGGGQLGVCPLAQGLGVGAEG